MPVFDVPKTPCFFFMLGKTASSIAAQAASSIRDHIPAINLHQMRYICAMDAKGYTALEEKIRNHDVSECEDAHYYNNFTPASAASMIDQARQAIMPHSADLIGQGISMNGICVYYVVQAGEVDAASLFAAEASVRQHAKANGFTYRNALCVLLSAKNDDFAKQGQWLSQVDGNGQQQVKNGFQDFEKILLLTPKDNIGDESEAVRRKMEDAFPIALLLAHNSNYVDKNTQVYTIAYDKLNATSADLRLLRDHLASEELENWFSRTNGSDPWMLLSTRSLPVVAGDNPLQDALEKSAKAHTPTLADLALNLPLQEADLNILDAILAFEENNGRAMCNQENWSKQLASELLEAIKQSHQPDHLRDFLMDTKSNHAPKRCAYNIEKQNSSSFALECLRDRLNAVILPKKSFMEKVAHYNLRCLNAYYTAYEHFCVERLIWERAKCITHVIDDVCAQIGRWIDTRRSVLNKHLITDAALISNLQTLCGPYAATLRGQYRHLDVANDLLGFIDLVPGLYSEADNSWEELYITYRDQVQCASDFTSTFIGNRSNQQLANTIPLALDKESRLLSSWPSTAPLPHPAPVYMMQHDLAFRVQGAGLKGCLEIPGDLVERYLIFPMLGQNQLNALLTMGLFDTNGQPMPPVHPVNVGGVNHPQGNNNQPVQNPWNINVVKVAGQYHLTWTYADRTNSCRIEINGRVINLAYSFNQYNANGMGLPLQTGQLGKGSFARVQITNGGKQQAWNVRIPRTLTPVTPVLDGRVKVELDQNHVLYCYRYFSNLSYLDQGILRLEKTNGVTFDYDIVGTNNNWITLWCTNVLPSLYEIQ